MRPIESCAMPTPAVAAAVSHRAASFGSAGTPRPAGTWFRVRPAPADDSAPPPAAAIAPRRSDPFPSPSRNAPSCPSGTALRRRPPRHAVRTARPPRRSLRARRRPAPRPPAPVWRPKQTRSRGRDAAQGAPAIAAERHPEPLARGVHASCRQLFRRCVDRGGFRRVSAGRGHRRAASNTPRSKQAGFCSSTRACRTRRERHAHPATIRRGRSAATTDPGGPPRAAAGPERSARATRQRSCTSRPVPVRVCPRRTARRSRAAASSGTAGQPRSPSRPSDRCSPPMK